jgi:hypothetical protein
MIQAAKTIEPALNEFYGSLKGEQKSRFNALGQRGRCPKRASHPDDATRGHFESVGCLDRASPDSVIRYHQFEKAAISAGNSVIAP